MQKKTAWATPWPIPPAAEWKQYSIKMQIQGVGLGVERFQIVLEHKLQVLHKIDTEVF